jgi:hypothetical protein
MCRSRCGDGISTPYLPSAVSIAHEDGELHGLELPLRRTEAFRQQEDEVAEDLDLGRMPVALRALDRERVKSKALSQRALLGLRWILGEIRP